MDVLAATPTGSSGTITFPPPAAPPAPAPADGAPAAVPAAGAPALPGSSGSDGSSSGSGSGVAAAPTPGLALLPPHGGSSGTGQTSESLPGNVGKLYGAAANTTSVSFEPAAGSNEIVTVVTNTQTGKVVVQFPSETLIALAQFFQKLDNTAENNGAVVDKKV